MRMGPTQNGATHVAASASGESVPKLATATAIASSKLFDPVVCQPFFSEYAIDK